MTQPAEAAHALLGPSAAERWITCPPSARLGETYLMSIGGDPGSSYAAQGTLAHSLAEVTLRFNLGTAEQNGISKDEYDTAVATLMAEAARDGIELDSADRTAIGEYVGYVMEAYAGCQAVYGAENVELHVEQRLDLRTLDGEDFIPESFGTGDAVIVVWGVLIHVIDLKFGKGVPVSAEGNSQCKLYGLGAWEKFRFLDDFASIRWTIHQPRLDSVSTDEASVSDLLAWARETVRPAALLAYDGGGELAVSEKGCKFCPVKAQCPARGKHALEVARSKFVTTNITMLTPEQLAAALPLAAEMKAWANDVEAFCLKAARDEGLKIPGYKLVQGKSNRAWLDEMSAYSAAGKLAAITGKPKEEFFVTKEPEPLSVAQMEKLVGTKHFAEVKHHWGKPPGKATLVPETDKRETLDKTAEAGAKFGPAATPDEVDPLA